MWFQILLGKSSKNTTSVKPNLPSLLPPRLSRWPALNWRPAWRHSWGVGFEAFLYCDTWHRQSTLRCSASHAQRILRGHRLLTHSWEGDSRGTPGKAQVLQAQEVQSTFRPLTQSIVNITSSLTWEGCCWWTQAGDARANSKPEKAGLADPPAQMYPAHRLTSSWRIRPASFSGIYPYGHSSLLFYDVWVQRLPESLGLLGKSKTNHCQRLIESGQNLGGKKAFWHWFLPSCCVCPLLWWAHVLWHEASSLQNSIETMLDSRIHGN